MTTPESFESDTISHSIQDGISLVQLKRGAFNILTNLDSKRGLFELLSKIDEADTIRGLVVINSDSYPGEEKYRSFLQEILNDPGSRSYEYGTQAARMRHTVDQLTLLAVNFSKPMVAGIQGQIVGEFFGTVLPFDFRYATEDTKLLFPSVQLGFPPSGPLTFYMNRFLGAPKATEIIMSGQELDAADAMNLGLLTAVPKSSSLLEECMETVIKASRAPAPVLDATRKLLHPEGAELEAYLDKAFHASWRALTSIGKVS